MSAASTAELAGVVEKYADQVASALRDAAPQVWRAATLSAWAEYLIPAVVGLLLVTAAWRVGLWCQRRFEETVAAQAATLDGPDLEDRASWRVRAAACECIDWLIGRTVAAIFIAVFCVWTLAWSVAAPLCAPYAAVVRVVDLVKPGG